MLDSHASSAKSLTLAAIIIQAVFLIVYIVLIMFFYAASSTTTLITSPGGRAVTTNASSGLFIVFSTIILLISIVSILWIALDYVLIYRKLKNEKVREAEIPALVLGIVQLLFGGIISGILLIIAYIKIKDSISSQESQNYGNTMQ